jgi:hypothetical protein
VIRLDDGQHGRRDPFLECARLKPAVFSNATVLKYDATSGAGVELSDPVLADRDWRAGWRVQGFDGATHVDA